MTVLKMQLSPGSRSCQARFLADPIKEHDDSGSIMMMMRLTMRMTMTMMLMMMTISKHLGRRKLRTTPHHTTGGRRD